MTEFAERSWTIVGCGRVGTTLARLAERLGIDVLAAWTRTRRPEVFATHRLSGPITAIEPHLPGTVVWVTVTDDALEEVAGLLSDAVRPDNIVLHCSGSLSSDVLRDAGVDARVGSAHPLLAIADPSRAVHQLSECSWTVEGDEDAVEYATWLLDQIGVEPVRIAPEAKTLYHASAVTSAGLLVSLMEMAVDIAEAAGIERTNAREMLVPLAKSTLANLEVSTPEEALTGPVAREDVVTIRRHLDELRHLADPSIAQVYELLTRRLDSELLDDD